jgi:hypothetical protein
VGYLHPLPSGDLQDLPGCVCQGFTHTDKPTDRSLPSCGDNWD